MTPVTSCGWQIVPRNDAPNAPTMPSTRPPNSDSPIPWRRNGARLPEKIMPATEIISTTDSRLTSSPLSSAPARESEVQRTVAASWPPCMNRPHGLRIDFGP